MVLGYQRTLKDKGRLSPMVIFVLRVCDAMLYAVAASTTPGLTLLGAACTSRLMLLPTCRWLSWRVPESATTRGV